MVLSSLKTFRASGLQAVGRSIDTHGDPVGRCAHDFKAAGLALAQSAAGRCEGHGRA
jgi:hypothetical protein